MIVKSATWVYQRQHILTVTLCTVDEAKLNAINDIQSLHLSTDHQSVLKNKCELKIPLISFPATLQAFLIQDRFC